MLSNDAANRVLNRHQVVPLSSKTERVYPGQATVRINGRESKAMADQIRTLAAERFRERLGRLSVEDLREVERVVKQQLGL